jgi:general secretion pathway protein K
MFNAKRPNSPTGQPIIGDRRGVAILVTIAVVAVLLTAGLELNRQIRSSVSEAILAKQQVRLSEMATSGVQAAMVMLINDRKENNTDTVQEDWANPDKVAEMMQLIPFDEGHVDVSITDERGKIQVNALVKYPGGQQFVAAQRNLWKRLLDRVFSLYKNPPEGTNSEMIIDSLKDWLDSGDDDAITGLSGAESDYYESLDPPYSCKNGPFDSLGEVALVHGITPQIFTGAGGVAGLSSLLTVQGATRIGSGQFTFDGKINISTAGVPVLAALLPTGDADLAQALADYRVAKKDKTYIHDITNPQWYKNVPGAGGVTIDANLITTSSDLFRIVSTATLHKRTFTVNTVVQREKQKNTGRWICKTLIWQED